MEIRYGKVRVISREASARAERRAGRSERLREPKRQRGRCGSERAPTGAERSKQERGFTYSPRAASDSERRGGEERQRRGGDRGKGMRGAMPRQNDTRPCQGRGREPAKKPQFFMRPHGRRSAAPSGRPRRPFFRSKPRAVRGRESGGDAIS